MWLWLRLLLSVSAFGAAADAVACTAPTEQFHPVNRHFDRIVVGQVARVDSTQSWVTATVRIKVVALGAKGPQTVKLRWPTMIICGVPSPIVKPGDDVAIYANGKSGADIVAGWLRLDWAMDSDPQVARAVPELVRERRLLLYKEYAGGPIPRGDSASWVTNEDYPGQALREGVQGLVRIQATVDDSGKAVSCRVTLSSGSALLDETTCKNYLRRARFRQPLLPAERTATFEHRWVLPPPSSNGS